MATVDHDERKLGLGGRRSVATWAVLTALELDLAKQGVHVPSDVNGQLKLGPKGGPTRWQLPPRWMEASGGGGCGHMLDAELSSVRSAIITLPRPNKLHICLSYEACTPASLLADLPLSGLSMCAVSRRPGGEDRWRPR